MWRKRRQSKYSSISTWALGLHFFFILYFSNYWKSIIEGNFESFYDLRNRFVTSRRHNSSFNVGRKSSNIVFYAKNHGNINLTLRLFSVFVDFKEERNFVFSLRINMTMTNRISEVALSSSWWVWRHIQI